MITIEDYAASFSEEPGYLNFAHVGPIGQAVRDEQYAQTELLAGGRFGTVASLLDQGDRVRAAIARVAGVSQSHVEFQPNASTGLMHAMFGLSGEVAISPAEFPAISYAAVRANEAVGAVRPVWLETDHGRVTPGNLRPQLTESVTAVAVSLVDYRTGYLADLEGIRQVIGDRLLILDAAQGFGVVDAPYELADVIVSGGHKWVRAGWGTGLIALSERAAHTLVPVFSGFPGAEDGGQTLGEIHPPQAGVGAFQVTNPDYLAQARLAVALEEIAEVGVPAINASIAEKVSRILDLADEYAIPVVSPRDPSERAGIVVVDPPADQLTVLTASLFNHGITTTTRGGQVRFSAHVSTDEETIDMLRASFISFASAISV